MKRRSRPFFTRGDCRVPSTIKVKDTVTIWSIQSEEAFAHLRANQILRAEIKFSYEHFLAAYQWMSEQLRQRVPAPSDCRVPLWGWYQFENEKKKKPDLRQAGYVEKGMRAVRLKLELPIDRVVLSDFNLWHYVLNQWNIPGHLGEEESPDSANNWERIFDLDWYQEGITERKEQKAIQATFWEIRMDEVVEYTFFKGR
ncbi:MAG TPA: hypothetical protein DIC34_13665 [Treponema sp.]|nr:hypothetical protein [Treponema sp.]